MSNEQITVKFDQIKGQLKNAWGKLSDAEIANYDSKPDLFFTSVKDKYGTTKEDVEKRIAAFKPVDAEPKAAAGV